MVTFTWGLSLDYCHIRTVKLLSNYCQIIVTWFVTYGLSLDLCYLRICHLRTVTWGLSLENYQMMSLTDFQLIIATYKLKTVSWRLSLEDCHLITVTYDCHLLLSLVYCSLRTICWGLSFENCHLQTVSCNYQLRTVTIVQKRIQLSAISDIWPYKYFTCEQTPTMKYWLVSLQRRSPIIFTISKHLKIS